MMYYNTKSIEHSLGLIVKCLH